MEANKIHTGESPNQTEKPCDLLFIGVHIVAAKTSNSFFITLYNIECLLPALPS